MTPTQKETFIIRSEWYDAISELTSEDQACILRNLFAYHMDQDIQLDNISVKLVWKLIEPTLARQSQSYDKRKEQSKINGLLGGRPTNNLNKPINNLINQTDKKEITQIPIITLYDSVSDSVSDSEELSRPYQFGFKDLPEFILPGPTDPAADVIFYEQICMSESYTMPDLREIYTKWIGDRPNTMYTLYEAKNNFKGYCVAFKRNERNRKPANTFGVQTTKASKQITYTEHE